MIRLGLIGCGRWGANYIKAADGIASVKVIGRGEQISGVDAVCVTTPPTVSVRIAECAMALGLPVLIEKPAGLSTAEAQRLVDAETYGALVLVGHQHLFAEGFEMLRAMGAPEMSVATFCGPVVKPYPARWDYGPHAISATLALGADTTAWTVGNSEDRVARVEATFESGVTVTYDGYANAEPPLTRQVRAFAKAVRDGGTDDYRFGAHWAVDVARVLEAAPIG